MLVLSRFKGEKIVIGDDITVMIVHVHESGKVRVGIEAPRDMPVHRQEVVDRIRKEDDESQTDCGSEGTQPRVGGPT